MTTGLILAPAGIGFLWSRVNNMNDQLSAQLTSLHDDTPAQISKVNHATTALLEQRLTAVNDALGTAMKGAKARMVSINAVVTQTRSASDKQAEDLRAQLESQQQQVTGQIATLKDATASADTKIQEVSTDVGTVKAAAASTQEGLNQTSAELKRVIGDMGTMSELIATNADELKILRALGERNYVEFHINKKQATQKVGDIAVALKSADPKRNRYTIELTADDQRVQERQDGQRAGAVLHQQEQAAVRAGSEPGEKRRDRRILVHAKAISGRQVSWPGWYVVEQGHKPAPRPTGNKEPPVGAKRPHAPPRQAFRTGG